LDETEIDLKVQAIAAYSSQDVAGVHPINGIKQEASAIGAPRRLRWAEHYALVRRVRP
jgi:hypothetical protein